MHRIVLILCLLGYCCDIQGQKTLSTGNASIKFESTRNSDVTAVNNQVNVSLSETGELNLNVLIRGFRFEMTEMEEHFNNEYLESDKYPNASFKGKIVGLNKIDFTRTISYKVRVEGDLSIHNVTKKVLVIGKMQIDKNVANLQANFRIEIEDYKIDTGLGGVIIGNSMEIVVVAKCQ